MERSTHSIHFQVSVDLTSLFESKFFGTFVRISLVFTLLEVVGVGIPFLFSIGVDYILEIIPNLANQLKPTQKSYKPGTYYSSAFH